MSLTLSLNRVIASAFFTTISANISCNSVVFPVPGGPFTELTGVFDTKIHLQLPVALMIIDA